MTATLDGEATTAETSPVGRSGESVVVPTRTVQTGNVQTGTVQTGTVQTGTVQTGTVQTGTVQTGTVQTGNMQISRIEKHFGGIDARHAGFPADLRVVFVCFTQRCGSTHLAQLVAAGGGCNLPREYLNHDYVIQRASRRGLADFGQYLTELMRSEARADRLFVKITPLHLGLLEAAGVLGRMTDRADCILVERADKLAQAIALVAGRHTGAGASTVAAKNLVYDRGAIDRALASLTQSYRQFDLFFGMHGLVPVQVVYEQLVADPQAALQRIAGRLQLPGVVVRGEIPADTLPASEVEADWRRRFLRGDGLAARAELIGTA